MLQLRAYAPPDRSEHVQAELATTAGVHHLVVGGTTSTGMIELRADVDVGVADQVLDVLRGELAADDVTLWRADSVRPLAWRKRPNAPQHIAVWSDVAGRAQDSARPALVYTFFMMAAGVIAGVGVLTGSSILVVGAMAISPDLMPMAATAVGLVQRRWDLALKAMVTLWFGMLVVGVSAAATTWVLRLDGRIAQTLDLASTVLGPSLTHVGAGSVLVALAAGVAGMLAYETAGSAAVGVAISVTTIPAAAYAGDALALQGYQDGWNALIVLVTNVVGIVTAAFVTLAIQRRRNTSRR